MAFDRFWTWFDRLARADFAGSLLNLVFDWKSYLWLLVPGGSGMTFFWAAIEGRSPLDVWVAAVWVAAGIAVVIFVLVKLAERRAALDELPTSKPTEGESVSEYIPNLRVANSPLAVSLFQQPECDKLIPLFEAGKIDMWTRKGIRDPLRKLPRDILIPRDHWDEFQFDWMRAIYADENFSTATYNRKQSGSAEKGGYRDIYLERETAVKWLESDAASYRGFNQR